jgi:hypothetical protein
MVVDEGIKWAKGGERPICVWTPVMIYADSIYIEKCVHRIKLSGLSGTSLVTGLRA